MGKKKNKKTKELKPIKVKFTTYQERCKPPREPKVIPKDTFEIISEYMLQLSPVHRNVFVTMAAYPIKYINPMLDITDDGPTHLVIFCLRLIMSDHFNPIGVVLINERLDQSEKLAITWKALLQDLAIIRLIVVATLSTASSIFHNVLSILTKNPNLESYTGPIVYTVWPYKQILHLYDYHYLMLKFQDTFYEAVDIFFITCGSDDPTDPASHEFKLFSACWTDILLILATAGVECMYTSQAKATTYLSIFTSYFRKVYYMNSDKDLINTETKPSTDRLMGIFWMFAGITEENLNIELDCLQGIYDHNEDLRFVLASARFRSSNRLQPAAPSKQIVDLKDDASTDSAIELGDDQMRKILSAIDDSLDTSPVTPFDIFLHQVVYDKQELLSKQLLSSSNSNALNPVAHDHGYLTKEFPHMTESQSKLIGCHKNSHMHKNFVLQANNNSLKKHNNNVSDELMLIPYETPKMPKHCCENCNLVTNGLSLSNSNCGQIDKINDKTRQKQTACLNNTVPSPANGIKKVFQRITNTFADEESDPDDSYNRTIDGLDLANSKNGIFIASCENALQLQSVPIKSDSVDSLAELYSTCEDNIDRTEICTKYVIPKPKTVRKHKRRVRNCLQTSNSESHLPINEMDLLSLKKSYQLSKSRNSFINGKGKSKSPVEELESLLGQGNGGQQASRNNDTSLAPCCTMPSTSDIHSPTFETRETISLPHYTRFDMSSCGDNLDNSNNPAISNNNTQETEKPNEIDYQEYRNQLLSTFCDKEQPNCDIIFKDKDRFNKLFNSIPKDCYPLRISTDWLCTLKGYLKLKEILERRKVRFIRSNLLCLEHMEFFVTLVKKIKNGISSTIYEGSSYSFIDYKCSFELLNPKGGVYVITPDDDVDMSAESHQQEQER